MMQYEKLLVGESQERARIGAIFERLYGIKDLHDAVYRASSGAGFAARRLAELGYTDESKLRHFCYTKPSCVRLEDLF
ncbi:hypothetical protein [Paenibacillus elgii]|uniref:hypothetical protein n=1 Tax=Paenibacillus elgii TaxID=189691 RepID=UPI0002D56347|nr:hypothetical protein [Paenibacillus elgii]